MEKLDASNSGQMVRENIPLFVSNSSHSLVNSIVSVWWTGSLSASSLDHDKVQLLLVATFLCP